MKKNAPKREKTLRSVERGAIELEICGTLEPMAII
jgi:hypothetical protein